MEQKGTLCFFSGVCRYDNKILTCRYDKALKAAGVLASGSVFGG